MLVDTSIWVEYFHEGRRDLAKLLEGGSIRTHPLVIGELACGRFRDRRAVFNLLNQLPSLEPVSHDEAHMFLEQHGLSGHGLGWIDVHLLASARLGGARVWTRDRDFAAAARRLGLHVIYG
jgi:hypothetical protein